MKNTINNNNAITSYSIGPQQVDSFLSKYEIPSYRDFCHK